MAAINTKPSECLNLFRCNYGWINVIVGGVKTLNFVVVIVNFPIPVNANNHYLRYR